MAVSFQRTFGALRADKSHGPVIALSVAVVMLAAWLAWALTAQVSSYRSSVKARIEVLPAPTKVAAPVTGRVIAVHLDVGARVADGDVLVELDATSERIAADKARARVVALAPQVESLERELAAEDDARLHGGEAAIGAEREVLARLRAAEAELAFAEQDFARESTLASSGASPQEARERAASMVKQRRAALEALEHESESLEAAHRERSDSRRARREQLSRQHGELADQLSSARAESERLTHELARRTIRAPLAGTLGEVVAIRPGAVVQESDVVATVVPDGSLHVVADYGVIAFGRLAVGQPARVRLDGFPWTRYGSVGARVARVATELRDGTIRVELDITDVPATLTVHHGMTGTVDVEVERTSPVSLMLRSIGEDLDSSRRP